MMILINLRPNPIDSKWHSTISYVNDKTEDDERFKTAQSQGWSTKDRAWLEIKQEVKEIDYEENTVLFNGVKVVGYEEVKSNVVGL